MAQENGIIAAKLAIERALNELDLHKACSKVHVFETEWGNLRALIGSGAFERMSPGKRLEIVWDYLREKVSEDSLKFLRAVHPMSLDEYDRQTLEVNDSSDFPK